jgi:RNA polymerase sigma-70 factor, ECF subfamily
VEAEGSWIEPLALALERPAFQLAMLLVEDPSVAEDIVQQAFVRVWQSPRTPRELPEFRPWLYRAVVNLAHDYHRRRARWAGLRLPLRPTFDPARIAEQAYESSVIGQAISMLNRREREAIYLRFFEDASYDEIGRIIGRRAGAVRVLVHRALRKLRHRLMNEGLVPEGRLHGA